MSETTVNETPRRRRALSCIQPSGVPTLGNYLGAMRHWVTMQEEYDCCVAVADLHAITVRQEPAKFRRQISEMFALLLAIGMDPEKSLVFVQSQVPAHAQLAWLLACHTQFGELSRMTQFKDKAQKHADNINAGLFSYPALMAADILLYQPDVVPVGADQKQHCELTRDIAGRFNSLYGDTFLLPEPYIMQNCANVLSLQEPTKKMSKSDSNQNAFISMLDDPDTIRRKFLRAVTDSEAKVCRRENKPGVGNLMEIYGAVTGHTYDQIEAEFDGQGYGAFKPAVGEAVVECLRPIREETERILKDKAYLESVYKAGAEKAAYVAGKTLRKVYKKIGFVAL